MIEELAKQCFSCGRIGLLSEGGLVSHAEACQNKGHDERLVLKKVFVKYIEIHKYE